ncbi:MAG: ubiquinol-cytochrome c reductase iron-sulfur subunit [Desulfobulbaceae bacterium]|uniref:Ubiquinol-cytochrome c reductase iron-sulfur subunit n=1 Tax=Candidatus Desulfatifera sulfidica TaxID=2841691 RepID=A0A8J6N7F9_9BACT|nr:ubiquinol-cytochrome c reductase iron-sulfur subunit [Candidatus Desulfatifera sulfidica]
MNRRDSDLPPASPQKRRFLILAGLLTLFLPLLRFLGFRVPKKPRVIEVTASLAPGEFFTSPDFILFDDGITPWAISRTCTHLGCKLNYREKENILECPCHQSRFSPSGGVLNGPAKKELPRFNVEKLNNSDKYLVTLSS